MKLYPYIVFNFNFRKKGEAKVLKTKENPNRQNKKKDIYVYNQIVIFHFLKHF